MDIILQSLEVLNGTDEGWEGGDPEQNFIEFWELHASDNNAALKAIPEDMELNPGLYQRLYGLSAERMSQISGILSA